jgi:hypothetical protein
MDYPEAIAIAGTIIPVCVCAASIYGSYVKSKKNVYDSRIKLTNDLVAQGKELDDNLTQTVDKIIPLQ